ncbi:hypothetical protein OIU77_018636 [Salix suchowensis]|uniref:DRBM domain-containing protein n=1 Tax=Salix suchowensis TaxID=1278906 RepID=A0ABQ9CH57_9ROSI|nr:hypothetical protein OIU77_018636 [Salix suchowensis]
MYKNQLQELAQRSCFNLPSYSCIREGPDHAPRFKSTVNFNGETFESPTFCSTLRLAEHAAAEVALNTLASRGPSKALIAGVLDETGVYKNLLQETAHRAGLKLPVYTTVRSGPGHVPVFSCTVELAGMNFTGESARTKKQAQKNAAMAAWSALKRLVHPSTSSSSSSTSSPVEAKRISEEQEQVVIARVLASLQPAELKNSKQNDSQRGHERFFPVFNDLIPPIPTLYPVQCHSWAYPSFSPEMAIYQMWQQEELFQLQNRLLALQIPSVSPGPQIFPYMQSMLPSDSVLFNPLMEQETAPVGPRITIAASRPLYLADRAVPDSIKGESTVTISEIHEEKSEESLQCSTSVIPDPAVVGNFNAEPRPKDPVDVDDKQMKVELERKVENVKPGDNQTRKFEWASSSNIDSGYRPVDFQAQNKHSYHSSQVTLQYPPRASSLRSCRPSPSAAPPVMIRSVRPLPSSTAPSALNNNVGPPSVPKLQDLAAQIPAPPRMRTGGAHSTYLARPLPQRMNPAGVHPRFMAPAVRIRSVVPVCSAPPARRMPTSGQVVPDRESKATAVPEDAKTASSELAMRR